MIFSIKVCECKESHGINIKTEPFSIHSTYGTLQIFPRKKTRSFNDFGFCKHCDKPYLTKEKAKEVVREAVEQRQRKKGFLTGVEIRELKKQAGISSKEFVKQTRINNGTLSSIEHGTIIQSKANDQVIRMKLKELLKKNTPSRKIMKKIFGYMIEQVRTSKLFLNKMMFYVDFLNFKKHGKSITKSEYIPLQYGPCPKNYQELLEEMIEDKDISPIEGHRFVVNKKPEMKEFSKEEMETINEVIALSKDDEGKKLFELSHMEKGFIETPLYQTISYDYARDLQIDDEILENIRKTG